MKKSKERKPTMKEVKTAIGNLINENYRMGAFINKLDSTLAAYIEYKKDASDFKEWIKKELDKEAAKNESRQQNSGERNEGNTETKVKNINTGKGKSESKS